MSKSLLSAVQVIVSQSVAKKLDQSLIASLQGPLDVVGSFFQLNEFQSLVLSFFLLKASREIEVDTEVILSQFGEDISIIPEIREVIDELRKKKLLIGASGLSSARKGSTGFGPIKANPRALDAVMEGDINRLNAAKFESFLALLEEIDEYLNLRNLGFISTKTLVEEVRQLLEENNHLPEVQYLLAKKGLSDMDYTVLMKICILHNTHPEVSLTAVLKSVFDTFRDRIGYKNQIFHDNGSLGKSQLVEVISEDFEECSNVKLTAEATAHLFQEHKHPAFIGGKPSMGQIREYKDIGKEVLYYNPAEAREIHTLHTCLLAENYQELQTNLRLNSLKPAFTILFHGFPGTGKTATVMQMALSTCRNVFHINMSAVQSKWIGETEKNVSKIFAEYRQFRKNQDKEPILLFNEADALLRIRHSSMSHADQIMNMMQNILLQELEDFEGIFMATTNLVHQLDNAFDRRFLYKIAFRQPSFEISLKILQDAFPHIATDVLVDINKYYPLTGGQISNIKKKLLMKELFNKDQDTAEFLREVCKQELIGFGGIKRNPIGFQV